jgi:hypothetical protein
MFMKNLKIKSKFIIVMNDMNKISNYLGFTPKSLGNLIFPSGTIIFNPEQNQLTNLPYKPNVLDSTLANDSFQITLVNQKIPQNISSNTQGGAKKLNKNEYKNEYYLESIGRVKLKKKYLSKSEDLMKAFKNILRNFSKENSNYFKNKKQISIKIKEKNSKNIFNFKLFKLN